MKRTIQTLSLTLVAVVGLAASSAHAASASLIRATQAQLTSLGYYAGPTDGVMGPKTSNALIQFQSSNALPVTGSITKETASLLSTANIYYAPYATAAYYAPSRHSVAYRYAQRQPVRQAVVYQPVYSQAAAQQPVQGYYRSTYQPVSYRVYTSPYGGTW